MFFFFHEASVKRQCRLSAGGVLRSAQPPRLAGLRGQATSEWQVQSKSEAAKRQKLSAPDYSGEEKDASPRSASAACTGTPRLAPPPRRASIAATPVTCARRRRPRCTPGNSQQPSRTATQPQPPPRTSRQGQSRKHCRALFPLRSSLHCRGAFTTCIPKCRSFAPYHVSLQLDRPKGPSPQRKSSKTCISRMKQICTKSCFPAA